MHPEDRQQLLVLNQHPRAQGNQTCTSHPLYALCTVCTKSPLRRYFHRCIHHAAYHFELAWCLCLQLSDPFLTTNNSL